MALNIEDIAKAAGVSRSTVSRVLNGEQYVSASTRDRVLAVIERENYTPNPAARALVTQRSQVIGVMIPHDLTTVFDNPWYFPTLLQGVGDRTTERGYAMMLWTGRTETEEDLLFRRVAGNRLMDGMVVASATGDNPLIAHLVESGTPMVTVERPATHADRISYVTIDNIAGARMAVAHLLSLGRRRIGIVTGALNNMDGFDRLTGYKQAMTEAGLPVEAELIIEGNWDKDSGQRGAVRLFEQGADAIFAANDIMALGVLEAAAQVGVTIPDDVALVGFDDLLVGSSIGLTTVRQPLRQKGAAATDLLIDLIEGRAVGPQHIVLPTQLIVRETCGAHQNQRYTV
jgi:LacI family transcriptional regulator